MRARTTVAIAIAGLLATSACVGFGGVYRTDTSPNAVTDDDPAIDDPGIDDRAIAGDEEETTF